MYLKGEQGLADLIGPLLDSVCGDVTEQAVVLSGGRVKHAKQCQHDLHELNEVEHGIVEGDAGQNELGEAVHGVGVTDDGGITDK